MQRGISLRFLLLCVALVHSGCAGNSGPAKNSDRIVVFDHISFAPPRGNDWEKIKLPVNKTKKKKFDHSMFFIKLFSKTEAAAMGAHVNIFRKEERIDRDMLLKYYDAVWIYPPDHPKYRVVDSQYSFDDSHNAPCLLYENKNVEKKVWGFFDSVSITKNRGIICVHPKYKNEIYTLNTNQEYIIDQPPINLENEFEPFLNSLQFH